MKNRKDIRTLISVITGFVMAILVGAFWLNILNWISYNTILFDWMAGLNGSMQLIAMTVIWGTPMVGSYNFTKRVIKGIHFEKR